MLLKDSFIIEAPVEAVWALLEDIQRLAGCVPGIENVEEIGPDTYNGALKIKIGPIAAAFAGQVTITERIPLERLVAEVNGQDKSSASLVRATFTGQLNRVDASTQLQYEMDIALRGKLAQFGLTVVQGTAKKMTAEFARCITTKLAVTDADPQNQSLGAA